MHSARMFKHLPTGPYVQGQRFQFVENLPAKQPEGEPVGHVDAIRAADRQQVWRRAAVGSSAMVGDRGDRRRIGMFTGKETGEFVAIDAADGKTLWQFQTGSGINAQPITYTYKGRPIRHRAGGHRRRGYWNQAREALKSVPPGGSVWTFALMPD